jgi:hypothetical protein
MAKKVHIVVIFWEYQDGTQAKINNYFSSKKKAWSYLQDRREDWEKYNPDKKWAYYTSDTIY